MKRTTLFFSGALLSLLVSCGAKNEVAFNDKLVNLQKGLLKSVDSLKNVTASPIDVLKKVQDIVKIKVAELSAIKAPSDGGAFKDAMMADFVAVDSSYDILVKMTDPAITEEQKTDLTTRISTWQSKIEVLDENVITEQKKFASAHNIKLQ